MLLLDYRKDSQSPKYFFIWLKWYLWNKPTILITVYYSFELISVCWSVLQIMMLWLLTDISYQLPGQAMRETTQHAMVSRTQLGYLLALHCWASYWNFQLPVFNSAESLACPLVELLRHCSQVTASQGCDVCSGDGEVAVDKSFDSLLWWPNTWKKYFKRGKLSLASWFLGFSIHGLLDSLFCARSKAECHRVEVTAEGGIYFLEASRGFKIQPTKTLGG